MPRSVLITTATLVMIAALGGYWLGQRQVTLDATGVIEAVATMHMETYGGQASDCVGWPGEGLRVFQVRCEGVLYGVDRLGRVERIEESGI